MPPPDHFYGIDIGGTKMELVAYDAQFGERFRQRVATPGRDFNAFVEAIAALVNEADAQLGGLAVVGIGLPGIIDPASGLQTSSNVPALNGQAVPEALRARLARPVTIGNDCQCFALSEANGGAAQGHASMFGAILGTGAGGGYCVNGRLLSGYNGLAGEWGHWALPAHLRARHDLPLYACNCGLTGCLERYVSGTGLMALYQHFGGAAALAEEIAARSAQGDAVAQHTMDVHLDLLAQALAGLVLAYDPHAIVLGGGLSRLGTLYEKLPDAVRTHLFAGVRVPPILPPAFGDAGGARGAALLARQRLS